MNNRLLRNLLLFGVAAFLLAVLPVSVTAQVGFQASFSAPASFVSEYSDQPNRLSVALYPKTYPTLSQKFRYKIKLIESSYESDHFRFQRTYYRSGNHQYHLIPIAVGAKSYNKYRMESFASTRLNELSTKQISTLNKKGFRRGLGISVALPKRLDKIFGEGGAGLRVSGRRRITFSGRSQWTDAADNDVLRQNKFPSLNMEQVSRFEIVGTIGSKISVKVNQDSQTDIPLANRIQIRYKGDEDDILKTIEAGNTTLSLPNTRFVGYSSRIRGLFGIKAAAQLGGLKMTVIASQEQGSTEKSSFSASGEDKASYLRDHEYVEGRIFDLGLPRDGLLPSDTITSLYIYELETSEAKKGVARLANLWVDPSDTTLFINEHVQEVEVTQIDLNQYIYYQDHAKGQFYVVFNSTRSSGRDLGYYMEFLRDGDTLTFGSLRNENLDVELDTVYNLKLMYTPKASSTDESWKLMWRNCYIIPRGSTIDDIDLKIFQGSDGTENNRTNKDFQAGDVGGNFIEILGLDQYQNGGGPNIPDGKVDDRDDIFRPDWGLLIFPEREPFNSSVRFTDSLGNKTPELANKVGTIYDYDSFTDKVSESEYYLQLSTRTRGSIIRLNKANIIEGSETVLLNGIPLARGSDYSIQYEFGQITLLTPQANDPNADIVVDFEYAPFFAVQKKTLLGFRAEYNWSENLKFGSTVLYKSDKAQERKPRVGQETAKMSVLDFDASFSLEPKFLTKAVDALPFVETAVASKLNFSGEIAQSHPNPNVNDIAYVDDFESAIEDLSLGTSRTNWKISSQPIQVLDGVERGRMLWHTPRTLVRVEDVYDRETAQGEGSLRTLRMVFRPNIRDTAYTVTIDGADTTYTIDNITDIVRPTWNGLTRAFSGVDKKRVQLFELRARTSNQFKGKLHFDFGYVTEDIDGNGRTFTEDIRAPKNSVDSTEDVGFDGREDKDEPFYTPLQPDPNMDNWFFLGNGKCPFQDNRCQSFINNKEWETSDSLYFEWLNGTEGNRVDVSVLSQPDEERFGTSVDLRDDYFSYEIDFSDQNSRFYRDSLIVEGSEKLSGGGQESWFTYRIPILDSLYRSTYSSSAIHDVKWSQIRHVRVWWESEPGQASYDTLEVAAWYFVQSNWQEQVIYSPLSDSLAEDASSVIIASISEDENPAFGSTPAEKFTDPTTNVTEPRKGLLINYQNLHQSDTVMAVKDLISVDRYSGYGRIQMYVYSDIDPIDVGNIKMFFRLGRDSLNFYEQQVTLNPGWSEKNYIDIKFDEITGIKDDGLKDLEEGEALDITRDGYRIKGNANINEVRYFSVGIVNADSSQAAPYRHGEVWLDELRVTDVRRDVGTAGRFTVSGSMADLISYNFNYQSQDPYFRGLSTATRGGGNNNLGSGRTQTSYSLQATINAHKFFPRSWSARLPVSISMSKSTTTPLLRTNSDIVLTEEKRKEEQTISESQTFSVSESFNKKGRNPLFTLLLNRLTTSYSYRRNEQRSVNVPYSFGENYSVNSGFNLGVTKVPTVPIFFWTRSIPILKRLVNSDLSVYPSSWRTNATYTRNLTITDDVNLVRRSSLVRNLTGRMDITYKMFQNLSFSFNYTTKRDLSVDDVETNFSQNFSANYTPALLGFLTTSFSYKATYRDDFNRSNESLNSSLGSSRGVSGSFDHIKLLGGKSRIVRSRYGGNTGRAGTRGGSRGDAADQNNKGSGKPFYDPPLALLRLMTGWIKSPTYQYGESYNSRVPGMVERAGWRYRFGLDREVDVSVVDDSRALGASEGESYQLTSGFKALGGITADVKYRRNITRDITSQSERSESSTTSWPDLSIRIQKFKRLPLFKNIVNKFIDVFTPRTGFTRQVKENLNIDRDFVTNRVVTRSFKPLLSVNFRVLRSLSLTGSYTLTENNNEKFSPITGEKDTESKQIQKTIAVSTQYSFTAPGGISIPLFGKLKFKSTMKLELGVKRNSSVTEISRFGGPFEPSVDRSDISITPVISYIFSQQIRGGLSGRWQDSNDSTRGQKSHIRELRIWAEISF